MSAPNSSSFRDYLTADARAVVGAACLLAACLGRMARPGLEQILWLGAMILYPASEDLRDVEASPSVQASLYAYSLLVTYAQFQVVASLAPPNHRVFMLGVLAGLGMLWYSHDGFQEDAFWCPLLAYAAMPEKQWPANNYKRLFNAIGLVIGIVVYLCMSMALYIKYATWYLGNPRDADIQNVMRHAEDHAPLMARLCMDLFPLYATAWILTLLSDNAGVGITCILAAIRMVDALATLGPINAQTWIRVFSYPIAAALAVMVARRETRRVPAGKGATNHQRQD